MEPRHEDRNRVRKEEKRGARRAFRRPAEIIARDAEEEKRRRSVRQEEQRAHRFLEWNAEGQDDPGEAEEEEGPER